MAFALEIPAVIRLEAGTQAALFVSPQGGSSWGIDAEAAILGVMRAASSVTGRCGIGSQHFGGVAAVTTGQRLMMAPTAHASVDQLGEVLLGTTQSVSRLAMLQSPPPQLAAPLAEVDGLCKLHDDWNGYGSDAPNWTAIDRARTAIVAAFSINLHPRRILASAEGGVGVTFRRGERYADVECFNSGEILGTLSDGTGNPTIFDVTVSEAGIDAAVERIREYLKS